MAVTMAFVKLQDSGRWVRAVLAHRSQLYAIRTYMRNYHSIDGEIVLSTVDRRVRTEFGVPTKWDGYFYELNQELVTQSEMESKEDWKVVEQ